MTDFLRYILRFLLFVLLQVAFFNTLNLGQYLYPCPYLLFLLLFPFSYGTAGLLLWGFAVGLAVDLLGGGILGLHTSAMLVTGLLRNGVLKTVSVKTDFEPQAVPGISTLGFVRYLIFSACCITVHQCVYFGLENFSMSMLGQTLLRIVASTLLNVALVLIIDQCFFSSKR